MVSFLPKFIFRYSLFQLLTFAMIICGFCLSILSIFSGLGLDSNQVKLIGLRFINNFFIHVFIIVIISSMARIYIEDDRRHVRKEFNEQEMTQQIVAKENEDSCLMQKKKYKRSSEINNLINSFPQYYRAKKSTDMFSRLCLLKSRSNRCILDAFLSN